MTKPAKGKTLSFLAAAAALAAALPCAAAYVRGELVWECGFAPDEAERVGVAGLRFDESGRGADYEPHGGASGDGDIRFRSPSQDYEIKISVKPDVPLSGMLLVEADVKGLGIGDGVRPWNGAKVMMPFTPPGKETQYPQTPNETGSFDWKTWSMVRDFGQPASGPSLVLGLEFAAGEFWVDAVRIYRVREVPDDEVVPPDFNEAAARIPRGPFAAGGTNPAARRGTMVGYRMEDEDVATLASWGANLARLQIGGTEMIKAKTKEAWFAALSNRLDWCEAAMDRCARHDIKVVLDLHVGPACVVSKNAANILPRDYLGHEYDPSDLVRAWEIIAARFRDHPATYGYDILNEPSVEPETWRGICRKVIAAVRPIDPATPFVVEIPSVTDKARYRLEEKNVIYSPHFYSPQELTHCGVDSAYSIRWSYPGYINGVWWDKEQIRVALKPWIDFQLAHSDAPVILRCRAWGRIDNSSDKSGTGGFVGNHSGGSIMDCCALMECTATDNGDASAGGFAGLVASAARIAVSWCSGCVDSRGGYVGAFVGKANAGLVTNSYYDTSANGSMEAAGKNSGGSTAYAGITPIGLGEKYSAASYPSFDFTNTWSIAEGVDEPRLMPPTGYKDFLDDCYLPLNTDPLFVMNGIPAGIRYIYDIPDEATSLIPMRHDALDDTWKPADGLRRPAMFFKWRVTVARVDE